MIGRMNRTKQKKKSNFIIQSYISSHKIQLQIKQTIKRPAILAGLIVETGATH
jgi:hypothetical protein